MSYRPLHDHSRYFSNPIDVFNQVIVSLKEAIVHEVVALDPREGDRGFRFTKFVDHLLIRNQFQRTRFPHGPRMRGFFPH